MGTTQKGGLMTKKGGMIAEPLCVIEGYGNLIGSLEIVS